MRDVILTEARDTADRIRAIRSLSGASSRDDVALLNAVEYIEMLDCRAGHALLRGERFIMVKEDEPYFTEVYDLIRRHEVAKKTWTMDCQDEYERAMRRVEKTNQKGDLGRRAPDKA